MAKFDGKFESAKQEWTTPAVFFDKLNVEFHCTVDLAADEDNTKCDLFFSTNDDALTKEWIGVGWLNPPYGGTGRNRLSNWVEKAYTESQKHLSTVVMLIPARTNTKWWHDYWMRAKEIKLVLGRPKFGDAKHGLPQPLAIVVFEPTDDRVIVTTFDFK